MQRLLQQFVEHPETQYVVSSSRPRLVNGKRSTNPRYLQARPDLLNPRDPYVAEIAARLVREIPAERPVWLPVNAVMAGRRNNPADPAISLPPLAVFNPIHYQELPELFMDFICSPHQGAVQRHASGDRPEQRFGFLHSHRVRRFHHLSRFRRTPLPGGSRH
jgi:hypothetical protein